MSADYNFYQSTYHGDVLSSTDFPKFITRADSYIDSLTMGRAFDDTLPEATKTKVKMAECAIAEKCVQIEKANIKAAQSDGNVASESVGSHSRSFRSGYEISAEAEAEISKLAKLYLGMTGLLYRGIPCTRHT